MEQRAIPVTTETFRSPLLPAAAVFSSLATLLGLLAVIQLFLPGSLSQLTQDLYLGGVTDPSALATWQVIHIALTLAVFLLSAAVTLCLALVLAGQIGSGTDLLYRICQWTLRLERVSSIAVLAILVIRGLRYIGLSLTSSNGIYMLYSMLVSEALMVVQAWFLHRQLRLFLESLSDSALSIGCSLTRGILDNISIPSFSATGFGFLAAICALTGADRLLTVTVISEMTGDHYALLMADSPLLLLSGSSLILAAVANMLLWLFLRRYKRISETLLYGARRIR